MDVKAKDAGDVEIELPIYLQGPLPAAAAFSGLQGRKVAKRESAGANVFNFLLRMRLFPNLWGKISDSASFLTAAVGPPTLAVCDWPTLLDRTQTHGLL